MHGIAMLSADKFLYMQKQTRVANLQFILIYPQNLCQNNAYVMLKHFHSFQGWF